jgi:hypothetical protein
MLGPPASPVAVVILHSLRSLVQASPATAATLHPCKIKVMVMATWELLSNSAAKDLLKAMLIESTGPALDRVLLFSAAAATANRPAGLLNGIPPFPSTGNLTNDLIAVLAAIAPVAGNGQIAIVASPDRATAVNLLPMALPHPILVSASLPSGTLIALAVNALVSAVEGAPRIEAAAWAAVHAEEVPATDIGAGRRSASS